MIELNIGHDGDFRTIQSQSTIAFVGLDDNCGVLPYPGNRIQRATRTTNAPRRITTGGFEKLRNKSSCRCFAVGAGHGHALTPRQQRRQHLASAQDRNAASPCFTKFRACHRNRRSPNHVVYGIVDVVYRLGRIQCDAARLEPFTLLVESGITPRNGESPILKEIRHSRHPDTANPDHMNMAGSTGDHGVDGFSVRVFGSHPIDLP